MAKGNISEKEEIKKELLKYIDDKFAYLMDELDKLKKKDN